MKFFDGKVCFDDEDFKRLERSSSEELTKLATQILELSHETTSIHQDYSEKIKSGKDPNETIETIIEPKDFSTLEVEETSKNNMNIPTSPPSPLNKGTMPRCNGRIVSIRDYEGHLIDE